MGRLRRRRRGGGPSRTITGLTRQGTATKLIGSKGGIQNPVVGEVDRGEVVEVSVDSLRIKTTPLPARTTAALLMSVDWENGGPYPDPATTNADIGQFGFAVKGDNLLTWANAACLLKFWVF